LVATAPGRVNLIGEHTDYTGGLVMPMAIQLSTTVAGTVTDDAVIHLESAPPFAPVDIGLPVTDPGTVEPEWGRYAAGVAAQLRSTRGLRATVASTLPPGGGLSSSAALEVAVALALGANGTPTEVAELCQIAETSARGVPCGIMDQLASAAGIAGHALLIDCSTLDITPVPVPDSARVLVVDSGQSRQLAGSAYADRRAECEAASALIGPLRTADLADASRLADPLLARRARHVIGENARVLQAAAALRSGDLAEVGTLMSASHRSLRDDFEVSTTVLDDLVDHLLGLDGVRGARLTGAGFGGCVVALCDAGSDPLAHSGHLRDHAAWYVEPSNGARVEVAG
jgi:galactokinase